MMISPGFASFVLSSDIDQRGWAFLNKNESEFVIVVIAVSPKPEFSQQFCPDCSFITQTSLRPSGLFFLNVEAPWSPKTEKAPVSESRGYCLNVSAPFICDWKSFLHSYSNDFTYLGLLKAMLDEIHSMFPTDRREESSLFARATVDLNLVPLNICGRVCVWSETDPRTRICVVCVLRPNHSASLPPFNFSKLFSATTIHYRFALQLECP